jgi:hypothetical protein
MTDGITNLAGIEVPSTDPTFLAVVGIHILLGLACTVTGAIAMLSQKRAGRHPRYGTIYFWCLTGLFLTATGLAVVRWAEDYHLFILGALLFAAACMGRQARRRRWRNWARLHITGMGLSYVLTNADRLLCSSCRFGKSFLRLRIGYCPCPSGYRSSSALCCGIRWRDNQACLNQKSPLPPYRNDGRHS